MKFEASHSRWVKQFGETLEIVSFPRDRFLVEVEFPGSDFFFLFLFRQKFHSVNLLPLIQFCARGKGNWLDFWSVVGGSNWEGFPTTGWASFRSLLGGKKLYRTQWVPSISASASGRSTLLNGSSFHFKFTTTGARHPAGRVLTAPEGSTVGLIWEVIWKAAKKLGEIFEY